MTWYKNWSCLRFSCSIAGKEYILTSLNLKRTTNRPHEVLDIFRVTWKVYWARSVLYKNIIKKNLRDPCSLRTRPRCAIWSAIKTWAMQKRIEMSTATFLMALKHDKWQISLQVKGQKGSASCNRQFIFNQLLLSVGQYGWALIVASVQHKMIQYLGGVGIPIFKLCIQRISWLPSRSYRILQVHTLGEDMASVVLSPFL